MPDPLTTGVARATRSAMELIYGLRACGVERDIAIPQVAVIGDQSSGKSSVLEAICSIPLPRGAGLTTRCAIELRLSNAHPQDATLPSDSIPPQRPSYWIASIFTSLDTDPVPLEGPNELEDAIAARAESLVDPRRAGGFSKERIIVQIASDSLPNLTIIDLPGIIRTKTFKYVQFFFSILSLYPFIISTNSYPFLFLALTLPFRVVTLTVPPH